MLWHAQAHLCVAPGRKPPAKEPPVPSLSTTWPSSAASKDAAGSMPNVPPVWMSRTRGSGLVTTSVGPVRYASQLGRRLTAIIKGVPHQQVSAASMPKALLSLSHTADRRRSIVQV